MKFMNNKNGDNKSQTNTGITVTTCSNIGTTHDIFYKVSNVVYKVFNRSKAQGFKLYCKVSQKNSNFIVKYRTKNCLRLTESKMKSF